MLRSSGVLLGVRDAAHELLFQTTLCDSVKTCESRNGSTVRSRASRITLT